MKSHKELAAHSKAVRLSLVMAVLATMPFTAAPLSAAETKTPPKLLSDGAAGKEQPGLLDQSGTIRAQEKVSAMEMRRCAALGSGDSAALAEVLADDYVHVHSTAKVEGKAEFIAGVKDKPRRVERGPLAIRIYGDAAVITGEMTNYFINADKSEGAPTRYFATQVVRLEQGYWKLVSMQVTALQAGR